MYLKSCSDFFVFFSFCFLPPGGLSVFFFLFVCLHFTLGFKEELLCFQMYFPNKYIQ